jgi:predicted peptidase
MSLWQKLFAVLAIVALVAPGAGAGEPVKAGFVSKTFKNASGAESPYTVFVPHSYDGVKQVPVILFLHGAGETKGGKQQPVAVGIGPAIKKRDKDFPFLVVIPQSEKRTWQAASEDGQRALAILDTVLKEYKTDPQRQYLTGLSMGGYGTWSIATANPTRFAAIAPICGGGSPKQAAKIKDLPCWCFHGGADPTVKPAQSRSMMKALWEAGGHPNYTEYPGVGHNSWDRAYATNDLYDWFLKHKTVEPKEKGAQP